MALVTGASGGWGSGVAIGLAEAGVSVVLNARQPGPLEQFAGELSARGNRVATAPGSIVDPAAARGMVEQAVESFGRLDILVNCAGGQESGVLLETSDEEWVDCVSTELIGAFRITKAVAEHLVAQGEGGTILNVAGGAGMYGLPGMSAHAAAKGGVASATWSWAEELRPFGITVNCFRGGVRSVSMARSVDSFNRHQSREESERADRDYGFYEPDEAAPLIVWLASSEARDVTGCYLGIDGPRISYWDPMPPAGAAWSHPRWRVEGMGAAMHSMLATRPRRMRGEELLVTAAGVDGERLSNLP